MYHGVLPPGENDPAVVSGHVHADALDRHLRWLRKHAQVVSFAHLAALVRNGEPVPTRATVLTFDDGLWNQAEYALPLLERYELPATFFISTDHIDSDRLLWFNRLVAEAVLQDPERSREALAQLRQDVASVPDREPSAYVAERLGLDMPTTSQRERLREALGGMTSDQLRSLERSELATVGAHTVSHPRLTLCTPERVRWEIDEGRRRLAAVTGEDARYFAFPEGGYDPVVTDAVRTAGFEAAAAVDISGTPNAFQLPRLVINKDATARMVAKWFGLVEWVRGVRRLLGLRTPQPPTGLRS